LRHSARVTIEEHKRLNSGPILLVNGIISGVRGLPEAYDNANG